MRSFVKKACEIFKYFHLPSYWVVVWQAGMVRGQGEVATPWGPGVGVVRVCVPLGQTHTLSPQSTLLAEVG